MDIVFSGGACLLNETQFLEGDGDLTVDCVAPSVTIEIEPATLTAPFESAVRFTDKVSAPSKSVMPTALLNVLHPSSSSHQSIWKRIAANWKEKA